MLVNKLLRNITRLSTSTSWQTYFYVFIRFSVPCSCWYYARLALVGLLCL